MNYISQTLLWVGMAADEILYDRIWDVNIYHLQTWYMKISYIGHTIVFHFLPDWYREAQWPWDIWSQNVVDDKAIICKECRSQNQPLQSALGINRCNGQNWTILSRFYIFVILFLAVLIIYIWFYSALCFLCICV